MPSAIVQTGYSKDFKTVLTLKDDLPRPTPNAGEILVKVVRACTNPVDYKLAKGDMTSLVWLKFPSIIGRDFSGIVETVPEENNGPDLRVGDRVAGFVSPVNYPNLGSFAEYICVKVADVAKIPKSVSFDEAAALPLVANTTYQALKGAARLSTKNMKVLVLGGTTATGLLALQMCRDFGCAEVVTTSSSKDLCLAHGATEVFNYKTDGKWEDVFAKREFDIVYDCVGGYDHWQGAQIVLKKSGGRYVTCVGDAPGKKQGLGMITSSINRKFWSLAGCPEYHVRISLDNKKASEGLTYFLSLLSDGTKGGKSIVDANNSDTDSLYEFSVAGAVAMFEKQSSGTCKGKLVMRVSEAAQNTHCPTFTVEDE